MLRFLLDEHISPVVAEGLKRLDPLLEVHALQRWEGGRLLGRSDAECLEAAAQNGLSLVSYDLRTIPSLLRAWTAEGRTHAGVVLVDQATIPPWKVGGLVRALESLYFRAGDFDWTNRVEFLRGRQGK
jgi:hypothetical protein